MKLALQRLGVATALATALTGARAASYVVDVQFPDDTTATPVTLDVEDFGEPQTAKSPSGVFVAVAARHGLQGKMLESTVNVIDNAGTEQASSTGIATQYLLLDHPLALRSPAGAAVVLTLKQIHE
ncbi:hypothetical protein LA345_36660 (plasmid) [Burkholderia vietnamiensis]|uniref:Uncharacterized protein n=1 Tax=Burkholderia vietnamiensis (strain G4 / LMG 22486) TaxID=269482 RepID=A4JVV4_BURVG|nr:hypothetical protein Bcep1808_7532 [Burkholderia vietnamiensis G4]MCB4349345.1 hypothetical protein [Burkholderia vietnamiensis]